MNSMKTGSTNDTGARTGQLNAGSQEDRDSSEALFKRFRHQKIGLHAGAFPKISFPPPPKSLKDLDVGFDLVLKLILKHLFVGGALRTDKLAALLAIPISLLEEPIQFLRTEALIEARSAGSSPISGLLEYSLVDRGRQRAMAYMDENSYCGPVPVSLNAYRQQVSVQTVKKQVIDQSRIHDVFSNIVVREDTLTKIGAAINSGRSIFVYGPAGVGKSFLASLMVKLLYGDIVIPHAVLVEGQIVRVFDKANHIPVKGGTITLEDSSTLHQAPKSHDERWVCCQRPVIFAGSELGLSMLDLQYQPDTKFYEAPLQMKANGGIFMIDDLGRQEVDSKLLLNRWIVPLENGIDYLSLHTGNKFQIPFDVIPVFATNLRPKDLADEAFLRRLGYKIGIDYLSEDEYRKVFAQYCMANDLKYDDAHVDYLLKQHYRPTDTPLVACHPRDLICQVIDYTLYEGKTPHITEPLLSQAWGTYFVSE